MNRFPLFFKTLAIGLLTLLLLIPLSMIEYKISERQSLQQGVQENIAQSSARDQTLSGPYLVLRYQVRETRVEKDKNGKETFTVVTSDPKIKIIEPHALKIDGNVDVESRKRGIYKAQVFNLHAALNGNFVVPAFEHSENIIPLDAHFIMGISDPRGIYKTPTLTLDGKNYEFDAGIAPLEGRGIKVLLPAFNPAQQQSFNFKFPLDLQGTTALSMRPVGALTEAHLTSAWPHPSFVGSYLPRERSVSDQGFDAQWQISGLAKSASAQNGNERSGETEVFSVSFIDPVNIYLMSERAVKYGLMFVVLVFTAFFLFEVLRGLRVHPMQYTLVGLGMAMFFLLIISLSEHIPFAAAYAVSSAACVLLIGFYLVGVLRSWRPALLFSGGIALLYGVLYGVLQSEDNALVMGTLILFAALATVMMLTRRMDWYKLRGAADESAA
ncbi:MAG: cell envelope integrity protein CreD [Methylobacillus sp.]|jgi:inner membrane protein|nr:cell envelope integrity protein CreD [Methylobacillus sp.]